MEISSSAKDIINEGIIDNFVFCDTDRYLPLVTETLLSATNYTIKETIV